MRQSTTFVALLASTVVAEDVVSFFFPGGFEDINPTATIEMANPSTTQMLLTYATGVDIDDQNLDVDIDMHVKIISGTSYELSVSYETMTAGYKCEHNTKAAEMTCTAFGQEARPQTAVISGSDITFASATVVKGAELLSASASAVSSASVTSSGLKTSASTTASGSAAASSQTSGSVASSSHASHSEATSTSSGAASPEHTGAAARLGMEASAILALAGVVALNLW